MEEQENDTPSQMLTVVQQVLVNNAKTIEHLESSVKEIDLRREKCRDDLTDHYQSVIAVLQGVYQFALVEIDNECEKKKEDLQRKEKYLTRCSLSLMSELENLKSYSSDAGSAVRRSKQTLEKLAKDLHKTVANVTFNFIPKKGKVKLGFLQLSDDLPQDFTLRLFTPVLDIKIGHQIRCGIEGKFTVENLRHLEFGIRRNNDVVPFVNLGSEGDVFSFSFTASDYGVYVVLACLFGSPIANSPLTLTIHHRGENDLNEAPKVNPLEVTSDTRVKPSETATECNEKTPSLAKQPFSKRSDTQVKDDNTESANLSESQQQMKKYNNENDENQNNIDAEFNEKKSLYNTMENYEIEAEKCNETKEHEITIESEGVKDVSTSSQDKILGDENKQKEGARAGEKGIDGTFRVGDNCVALWREDGVWYNGHVETVNAEGSFLVNFVDYGNSDIVASSDIVKSAPDIPKDVPEENVDENVPSRTVGKQLEHLTSNNNTENPNDNVGDETDPDCNRNVEINISKNMDKKVHPTEAKKMSFEIGERCVARWSEDYVWYNGVVQAVQQDGTYVVTFTDYGNSAVVTESFIVKDVSAVPAEDHVDENVRNAVSVPSGDNGSVQAFQDIQAGPKQTKMESSQRKLSDCGVRMITAAIKQVNLFNSKQVGSQSRRQGPSLASDDEEIIKVDKAIKTTMNDTSAIPKETSNAVVSVKETVIAQKPNSSGDFEIDNKAATRTHKEDLDATKEGLNETLIKKKRSKSKPSMPRPLLESKVKPDTCKPSTPRPLVESKVKPDTSKPSMCIPLVEPKVEPETLKPSIPRPLLEPKVEPETLKPSMPRPLMESKVQLESKGTVWKAGDVCLAQWKNGVWYNSVIDNKKLKFGDDASCEISEIIYNVTFTDYGNQDQVGASRIVKSHDDLLLRKQRVVLDENVKVDLANLADVNNLWKKKRSKSKISKLRPLIESKVKPDTCRPSMPRPLMESKVQLESKATVWKAGDVCLAQWKDGVWYNSVIDNKELKFGDDASCEISEAIYNVTFTDYGNKDQVGASRIVKSHDDLLLRKQHVVLDQNVKVDLANLADVNNLWKTGERCLAKDRDGIWYNAKIQDVNSNGLLTVQLIDYDRKAEVDLKFLVRTSQDIPLAGQQMVDQNVKFENKEFEEIQEVHDKMKIKTHVIGELGIARWTEDNIWYNAKIINLNEDRSLEVFFVDYGNKDTVKPKFFVKNTSLIEHTGEEILLDEHVEEYVDKTCLNQHLHSNSMSLSRCHLPISPDKAEEEFTFPQIKTEKKTDSSFRGSTFSTRSKPETEVVRQVKSFNILEHLTRTADGRLEMVVKCQLNLSDNLTSPLGISVLRNKNIVISCSKDDSVKIFRPDGTISTSIEPSRPFQTPTSVTALSSGEIVVRDDLGLQMFTQEGVFLRTLGGNKIDKCFGLAQDETGNIITINSARPSRTSKSESKEPGGLTDIGETDIFFICKDSGEVIQRIELSDVISDKNESKCRFLTYHDKTIYIVDLGLDCVYRVKVDGLQVFTVGETGTGVEQFKDPAGIVVDHFGNFIVADSRNHRLQIYDRDDNFVGFVAVDVPVRRPSGICLDKQLGELYVLNYGGNSMAKYRIGN